MRLIAAFVIVCAVGLQQQHAEYILDLLTYPHAAQQAGSSHRTTAGGSAGYAEGVATSPASLTVTLAALDRSTYAPGEDVIAEVVIENVGAAPVALPWSPDRATIGNHKSALQSMISLEVRDAGGRVLLGRLEPQPLYGSARKPGTLQTLAPGDRARIRIPSRWKSPELERDAILTQPGGVARVFAVYQHDAREDRSTTGVEVAFVSRSAY